MSAPLTLVAAHAAVHDAIEELWWWAAETLIALEPTAAKAHWAAYEAALRRHAEREDADVLPPFYALGDPPRGASQEILAGEHKRLVVLGNDTGRALDRLDDGATLRDAIAVLEQMLRLRHLFEHHGEREQQIIYPALDALGEDVRARVLAALA